MNHRDHRNAAAFKRAQANYDATLPDYSEAGWNKCEHCDDGFIGASEESPGTRCPDCHGEGGYETDARGTVLGCCSAAEYEQAREREYEPDYD